MPSKKGRPALRWHVILEEVRSESQSLLEAVKAMYVEIEGRIDRYEQRMGSRFDAVEAALESNGKAIAALDQRMEAMTRGWEAR